MRGTRCSGGRARRAASARHGPGGPVLERPAVPAHHMGVELEHRDRCDLLGRVDTRSVAAAQVLVYAPEPLPTPQGTGRGMIEVIDTARSDGPMNDVEMETIAMLAEALAVSPAHPNCLLRSTPAMRA